MNPTVLLQLDGDPQPSVFDALVAVDSGVDHLLRHGGITPDKVAPLVHGLLFTRSPDQLHRSAIFVGGSDVTAAEALFAAVQASFFGPFRVSALLDPNGANTTAAAAVMAAIVALQRTRGGHAGAHIAILGATGPVGQRVARLLLRSNGEGQILLGSRNLDRAAAVCHELARATGHVAHPIATADAASLEQSLAHVDLVIAAGAAGICLLPQAVWSRLPALKAVIDLNAVPPLGIEGIQAADKATVRDRLLAWGALGVGGSKMKIHRKAIQSLFLSNDRLLDAEDVLSLAQQPAPPA